MTIWSLEVPPAEPRAPAVPIDPSRAVSPRYGRTLAELEPGRVFRHPRALTVREGVCEDFARTFMEANALYLSDPHAQALGHPRAPAPPLLVFNAVLSLGVQNDSEQALANLGYEDARFFCPVYPADTLTSQSRVLERRERGPTEPGVVTLETIGQNQRGEIVIAYRRRILVPRGEGGAPPLADEPTEGAAFEAPRVAHLPALPPGAPTAGAGVFFEDLALGQIIMHRAGRTVTDEHIAWSYRTGNTHPLHYDRLYSGAGAGPMGGEPVVYGGLVFAWLAGLASRDITESALFELGFTDGYHTAPVRTGDTLSALSRVVGVEPGPPGTGVATIQLVGVKNHTAAAALERFGAALFQRELDKKKAGAEAIADKVFEVERRVLVRTRP